MPQKVAEGKCLLSQDFKDKSECATKRIEKAFQAQGAAYLKARRETPQASGCSVDTGRETKLKSEQGQALRSQLNHAQEDGID